MKKCRKNQFSNALKKTKENHELKSVEVNMVTKFIKDEAQSSANECHIVYDDVNDHVDINDCDKQERIIGLR